MPTASNPPDTSSGTVRLLAELAEEGDPQASLPLAAVLDRLGERAFGALLLLATLPAFIPLPFAVGAIAGPLVALVGLQLALGLDRPWLPGRLRDRPIPRAALRRFGTRLRPLLAWLERWLRPRRGEWVHLRPVRVGSGLLLIVLGGLLALPIPFTNYPFGLLLLVFAIALVEHDGRLLMIAWALGGGTVLAFALLSGAVAQWLFG